MTRHAKNCTASAVYSYHERKRDTSASGYGSKAARLGKDSIQEFDCCCLTLQPCRNPVITPDGHLYDKEAILEYIIHQKREIARQLKEYEKQKTKQQAETLQQSQDDKASKVKQFTYDQLSTPQPASSSNTHDKVEPSTSSGCVSNMKEGRGKALPSFWVPSLTPSAKATELAKPDEKVRCPMSGRPLRLKDLIDIHFTAINDRDSKAVIVKQARYVCPVTNDVLGNSVPCAVLKTSGNVVTMECVEKLIRKDMVDPTNSKKMKDKDIVPLQRGATGFAAAGVKLKAKKAGPALVV